MEGCLEYINKTACKKCDGPRYSLVNGECRDGSHSLADLKLTLIQLAGIGDF